MSTKLQVRPRSPAARADRLSFLEEVTPQEFSSYRPDQIRKILRQREEVQDAITQDTLQDALDSQSPSQSMLRRGHSRANSENSRSWLTTLEHECKYQICPGCRPASADRSFLSLSGVADGIIQPTSAVGFGFHIMGERPVVDAEILKTIRCRPVPLVCRLPHSKTAVVVMLTFSQIRSPARSSSDSSIMAMLGDQLALASENDRRKEAESNRAASAPPNPDAGRLRHSPRCDNLAVFSDPPEILHHGSSIRPPWTPPPSPSPYGQETATETHALGLAAEKSIASGRR
jgi:hypothetical protein